MFSVLKSLNDDKAAQMVQQVDLGPLDHSGTIYVLRSLSKDPALADKRMILHTIGVTSQTIRRRVADVRIASHILDGASQNSSDPRIVERTKA
ncbi:MAG: hypothetical protein V7661_15240 [Sulfitobacter sp.]